MKKSNRKRKRKNRLLRMPKMKLKEEMKPLRRVKILMQILMLSLMQ
jgi:hypothetical protein